MKKILIVSILLLGLSMPVRAQEQVHDEKGAISQSLGVLSVGVDARLEFLTAIQYMTDYWTLDRNDSPYYQTLEEHFRPYREHPALGMIRKVFFESGKTMETPSRMMLGLDHNFEPYDHAREFLLSKAHPDPDTSAVFLEALRTLAEDTRFYDFFEANKPYYRGLITATMDRLSGLDVIRDLEDFYGGSHLSYSLFIKPLDYNSYGITLSETDEGKHVGFLFGFPPGRAEKMFHKTDLAGLLWHEYGHTFVNPVTAENPSVVEENSFLFEPIEWKIPRSYNKWRYAINEQIIRAQTTFMAARVLGREAGERLLRNEQVAGFYYTQGLQPVWEYYEQNRETYPTFRDYFPEFMRRFAELKPETPVVLPVRRQIVLDSAYVILPDEVLGSLTDESKQAISKGLKAGHVQFLSPGQARETDLSRFPVVSYLNLRKNDNDWLSEQLSGLPLVFGANSITAGHKTVEGNDLSAFMVWKNPDNPAKDAFYCIALDSTSFIDLMTISFSGAGFCIFDEKQNFKAGGFFYKEDDKWVANPVEY